MTLDARAQCRLFRLLLGVYPAWFRRTHTEEMEDLFRARLERTRGGHSTFKARLRPRRAPASSVGPAALVMARSRVTSTPRTGTP